MSRNDDASSNVRPQTAASLVRQPDYSAMLNSLNSEMLWRTIVAQRQQRQDAVQQQQQQQQPALEGSTNSTAQPRPPVSPPPAPSQPRRPEKPIDGGVCSTAASDPPMPPPPAELPDLRSLATQYAHVVSLKRANPASMGATAPLSFTKDGGDAQRRNSSSSSFRGRRASGAKTSSGGNKSGAGSARDSIVTAFVLSGGLPVHPSIVQFLVPYERQGNKDFYTPENIQRRLDIRNHHSVIDALDAFWLSLPKALPSRTSINQPMFHWLHAKLYNHFAADPNNVVWTQVVFDDWKAGSSSRVAMTQEELQGFMFGFADVWCQTLSEEEYAGFLREAQRVVVNEGMPFMGSYAEDAGPPTTITDILPSRKNSSAAAAAGGGGGGTNAAANNIALGGNRRPRTADSKSNAADAQWTKEFIGDLAQIRALQAVAVAQQTEKVVEAFVATGISDVGLSEVRQLQGLFRLVCEVEEREEDELLRLSVWAKNFLEDILLRRHKTQGPEMPAQDDGASVAGGGAEHQAVDQLVLHLQRLLQLQEANMREFSVAEGADRRGVVLLMSRMLGVVAAQHTLPGQKPADDTALDSIADVKQKIASHWRAGSGEKGKLRAALKEALVSLSHGFSTVFGAVVGDGTQSGVASLAAGSSAQSNNNGSVAAAPPTPEERTYALTLLRELGEMQRQADVEMARAQETSTLVEFISKELAAQKPITTLMETALGNAQRMGIKMRQVEVGSAEWNQQIQSLSRIEIGLYNVVDALHQEMLKSVESIIDSCEATIVSAFGNNNSGRRFDRIPSHIVDGLDRERDVALQQCRQERSFVSDIISRLRLQSNDFFTRLCPDEKKALQRAACEESIRDALKSRNAFTRQPGTTDKAPAVVVVVADADEAHGATTRGAEPVSTPAAAAAAVTPNGCSPPPPQQQHNPVLDASDDDMLNAAWFCVIPDTVSAKTPAKNVAGVAAEKGAIRYRTFCAMQFFPFLQQRNVAWACHILGELTTTINDATMRLNRIRYACEAALAKYLKDAEQHAYDALVAAASIVPAGSSGLQYFPDAGKISPVDNAALLRTRADRDGWNGDLGVHVTAVVRETIHNLVGIPQSTMAAQHQFFLLKAYEWVEHLRTAKATAASIQQSATQCVKKEDVERMMAASDGLTLSRVNGEVDRFQVADMHRKGIVEALRKDELERLEAMRKQKEEDDHSERALRLLKTLESGNGTPVGDVQRKVRTAANERRRAAQSATLKRLTDTANKMREKNHGTASAGGAVRIILEQQQQSSSDALAVAPSTGAEHGGGSGAGSAASLSLLQQQLVACGALLLRPDGALVAPFTRDAAFERRKNVYIRNRCSNTDIFVGECVKRGCGIADTIRTQLSARPCIHDALVLPLSGSVFAGGGTLLLDVLGDLLWMNPIQYVSLGHCGLTNRDAQLLSTHLGGHQTLCSLDLRHNPLITDATPILRLLDMNSNLLVVAVQGTGIADAGMRSIQKTCLQHRHERVSLHPAEMCILVRHFQALCDPIDATISLARIDTLLGDRTASGTVGAKASRGISTSLVAAGQGLIALHCGLTMKPFEHWSAADVLQSLFPRWPADTVAMFAAAFARSH